MPTILIPSAATAAKFRMEIGDPGQALDLDRHISLTFTPNQPEYLVGSVADAT
jgi:hypothetical protein